MSSTPTKPTKEVCRRARIVGRSVSRLVLALALALGLALAPFRTVVTPYFDDDFHIKADVRVERSEAHAIAPVVGGAAAAAALAAELGISTEALLAGTMALFAVGTGVGIETYSPGAFSAMFDEAGNLVSDLRTNAEAFNTAYYSNVAVPPGFKPWDDLDAETKAAHGTAAAYAADCWFTLETEVGLTGTNGPTEPPEDPEDKKKWQKGRNILTLLGVGGAVAVGEAASWLANAATDGLYNLLFGTEEQTSMGLPLTQIWTVDDLPVPVMSSAVSAQDNERRFITPYNWYLYNDPSSFGEGSWMYTLGSGTASNTATGANLPTIQLTVETSSRQYYLVSKPRYPISYYYNLNYSRPYWAVNSAGSIWNLAVSDTYMRALNVNYAGIYQFPNGETLSNGVYSGEKVVEDAEYQTIPEVPTGLPGAVVSNPETYNNWFNNYENLTDDTKRVVTVPEWMRNPTPDDADRTLNYPDLINESPAQDVDPVPDTEPVNPSDPRPPDPTPGDGFDWDTDLGDAVDKLSHAVFDQLFPFCLIGDLQRFGQIISGQAGSDTRGGLNAQSGGDPNVFVLDFSSFGIPGMDELTIDLNWLVTVAGYCRPWWTLLVAGYLLHYSIAMFLKK